MLIGWTLITLLYACCRTMSSNVCPHERQQKDRTKFIGTRKDVNSCMTFIEVDWPECSMLACHEWLHYGPCKQFKNGGTVSIFSPRDLKLGNDWQRDVTLDYLLMGFHTFDFNIKTKSTVFYDEINLSWSVEYFEINRNQTEHKIHGFKTRNYWPGTDNMNDASGAPEYVKYLGFRTVSKWRNALDGKGKGDATCPTVSVKNGRISHNEITSCKYLRNSNKKVHHMCVHDAYNDCKMKIVSECHYVELAGRSYDRYMVIEQKPDPPYGKPCTNWTYGEIGAKICSSNCKGTWGQWSGEPKLICGTYNLFRFRPPSGSTPCFAQSHDCCMEMKSVIADVPCEDFAYNTTINLQKEKCLNGGKLGRDKMGHLMCECNSTFKGVRCETNMCTIECKNGGTCSVFKEQAFCLCQPSFSGSLCEDSITLCDNMNKCHNGGTCISLVSEKRAYCKCMPGFGGPSCQQSSTFCNRDSCSFHGVCYNMTENFSFKCRCYDGFTGERCEASIEEENSVAVKYIDSDGITSAVLVLIALFALCASGSVVTYRRHRHRRRKRRLQRGSERTLLSRTTRKKLQSKLSRIRKSVASKHITRSFFYAYTKPYKTEEPIARQKTRRVLYISSRIFNKKPSRNSERTTRKVRKRKYR